MGLFARPPFLLRNEVNAMIRTVFTFAALALLAAAVLGPDARAADRPNILVVLSDDHSAPHAGCYGNKDIRTPNIDRLAAEGLRFDRAYVACPQCVPSRAAIMTGRSPVAIAMTRVSAPLPADVAIYPELLRAAGYFSGVAGRTYHLDGSGDQPPEIGRASGRERVSERV
jgi:N-sulfoglucosamine sulfohydrolase